MDKNQSALEKYMPPHVSPKYPIIFKTSANGTNQKEHDEKNNTVWVNEPEEVPPLSNDVNGAVCCESVGSKTSHYCTFYFII